MTYLKKHTNIFILLFVFSIYVTVFSLHPLSGDDLATIKGFNEMGGGITFTNIIKDTVTKFNNFGGRLPIYIVTPLMIKFPILFNILNALIVCFVFYMIFKISKSKHVVTDILIVFIGSLLNFRIYDEAGLICTCTNYLWIFAFMLPSIYIINESVFNKKVNKRYLVISLLSLLIYSIWAEIVQIYLFLYSSALGVYYYYKYKQISKVGIIFSVISLFFIFYTIFICPGTLNRAKAESLWPVFNQFSVGDKIFLCFQISLYCFIDISLGFVILLLLIINIIKKNKAGIILSIFCLLIIAVLSILLFIWKHNGLPIFKNYFYLPNILGCLISVLFFGLLLLDLIFTSIRLDYKVIIISSLLCGTCTKAMNGFSAQCVFDYNNFNPSYRSGFFLYFTALIIISFIINSMYNTSIKKTI